MNTKERLNYANKKSDVIRRIKRNLDLLKKEKIYSAEWKRRESTLVDLLLNCGILSYKEREEFEKQYDEIVGVEEYTQAKPNPCYL